MRTEDVPTTGRRPRPCNAKRCVCKWLLFQMARENAKLRLDASARRP